MVWISASALVAALVLALTGASLEGSKARGRGASPQPAGSDPADVAHRTPAEEPGGSTGGDGAEALGLVLSAPRHPAKSQGSRPPSRSLAPTPPRSARAAASGKGVKLVRPKLNSVPTPPAASGDGILSLEASPWAKVSVDGTPLGETPREVLLTAGTHEVVAIHPKFGTRRAVVKVSAGQRQFWSASFER